MCTVDTVDLLNVQYAKKHWTCVQSVCVCVCSLRKPLSAVVNHTCSSYHKESLFSPWVGRPDQRNHSASDGSSSSVWADFTELCNCHGNRPIEAVWKATSLLNRTRRQRKRVEMAGVAAGVYNQLVINVLKLGDPPLWLQSAVQPELRFHLNFSPKQL